MRLFNNFTYLLDDPVNGDQFSQFDRRTLYGFNASHSFDVRFAGIETQTRVGLQTRGDDIHVGLFRTLQRAAHSTVREDNVREGNVGLWADTTARWTDWLRTTAGLRQDYFAGQVSSDMPENSGNASATMTSPKAGIVLGPWYKTEFFGNAGYGLHAVQACATTERAKESAVACGSSAATTASQSRTNSPSAASHRAAGGSSTASAIPWGAGWA